MKIALRLRDPSPDWVAMRKVIEENGTLRNDVTMEVLEDRCRFVDDAGREIAAEPLPQSPSTVVSDVEAKLRLLTMLQEKFSAQP